MVTQILFKVLNVTLVALDCTMGCWGPVPSCPVQFSFLVYDRHIHSYGDISVCVLCSDLLHHWLYYIYE